MKNERIHEHSISMKEIEEKWLPEDEEKDTDHLSKLPDQLNWLSNIGFKEVEVIWAYYGIAVYGGFK